MNSRRFEELVPDEILDEMHKNSIIYLPVGSMEWHGPHMGMGMDTVDAYGVSLLAAEKTGGVVYPPLYIGTECPRSAAVLKKLGFKGNENITGMDFPGNAVKSLYWPPDIFESVIRCQVSLLKRMGYQLIVIANGHGAFNQKSILDKIGKELSDEHCTVLPIFLLFNDCGYGIGHAGLVETSIMSYLRPEGVKLEKLPTKQVMPKLKNLDFAIVDQDTFANGGADVNYTVRYDPRDSSPEIGKKLVDFAVKKVVQIVRENQAQK